MGDYGHFHVRFFVSLPYLGEKAELSGIKWGPFDEEDEIEFIELNEGMDEESVTTDADLDEGEDDDDK